MAGKAASNKEHPLAGVVLCFTSILTEHRDELAKIAGEMGAGNCFDLTSDVTHLLVGETNTEKYKFVARQRPDIAVLQPEWVEAVRQSWMQGGDTDIRALEDQYKLPTFIGTAICITGFEDLSLRNYIQTYAEMNGADFRKDLTKTVTHLVARTAEGAKYKAATQWNVKVVSYKWFTDCVERGMILEETLYHPLLPEDKQGVGAWNRSLPAVQPKKPGADSSSGPRPRKLRRIASAKLGDQNENIWGDIVGIGFETAEPKPSREQRQADHERRRRDASAVQVAKSFASETTFAAPSQTRESTTVPAVVRQNGFLDGCFFLIHDFSSKQKNVLRNHLLYNGAQLVDSLGDFSRPNIPKKGHGLYIIVPYKTPRANVPSTDDLAFECEVVTDMWLERCLDTKTLVSSESHISNTPIPSFPVKGLTGMNICSTGFARIDLLHLSKLVNLVGATYNEYLKPTTSLLICNESVPVNHDKLRHTQEWGVPAVTAEWLWASIQQERKQPFEPYLIRKQSTQSSRDRQLRAGSHPEPKQPLVPTSDQDTGLRRSTSLSKSNTSRTNSIQEPKHTISESPQKEHSAEPQQTSKPQQKAVSPLKPPPEKGHGTGSRSPPKRKHPEPESDSEPEPDRPTTAASTKSALDSAVNGLLKHARSATSRSDTNPTGENDRVRSRRPRPLLGRAQSTSSGRAEPHRTFSRASSIDTLHEEGSTSAAESMSINTNNNNNNNSNRFDFNYHDPSRERLNGIDEVDETPQMTQLDYEDPDAAAMREKFLRQAGKIVDKPAKENDLVIGEVKELEQSGWGTGRRTRNATRKLATPDDDDEF